MHASFAAVLLVLVLGFLWLPPLLVTLRLKRLSVADPFARLWLVWFYQLLAATSGIYLADRIGLLNPAGYVLAIAALTSITGAVFLWELRRLRRALS